MTGTSPQSDATTRGPHGWLNWQAQLVGQPRREDAHPDAVVIHPIWEEFALYGDAPLQGGWLTVGPYEFLSVDAPGRPRLGHARKVLVLRMWDHLADGPVERETAIEDDVAHYFGGDIGDELAALLGLAVGRRIRSGGSVRKGLPRGHEPLGYVSEAQHHAPTLEPPAADPMIEGLEKPFTLEQARPLLEKYPRISGDEAVALVRAARQYVDGLWLADTDPRLAWIKLIGALEAGAVGFDDSREPTALEQLKRHRSKLHRALKDAPPEVAETVAGELAGLFNVERKLQSFVKRFDPGPPAVRPAGTGWHFDWADLERAIGVIYEHRSNDLHAGIAFPWVLCDPPPRAEDGIPAEKFWALGVSGKGGRWSAETLPMYLHVFAHLVGGALRNWWGALGARPRP
jgi:hypothetical protein